MPVRRVMLRQVARLPANPQGAKHLDVSVGVRLIRIEQCAVPVKQHSLKGLVRQHETIVADARSGWRGPQIRGLHESWYHYFSPHSLRLMPAYLLARSFRLRSTPCLCGPWSPETLTAEHSNADVFIGRYRVDTPHPHPAIELRRDAQGRAHFSRSARGT